MAEVQHFFRHLAHQPFEHLLYPPPSVEPTLSLIHLLQVPFVPQQVFLLEQFHPTLLDPLLAVVEEEEEEVVVVVAVDLPSVLSYHLLAAAAAAAAADLPAFLSCHLLAAPVVVVVVVVVAAAAAADLAADLVVVVVVELDQLFFRNLQKTKLPYLPK